MPLLRVWRARMASAARADEPFTCRAAERGNRPPNFGILALPTLPSASVSGEYKGEERRRVCLLA